MRELLKKIRSSRAGSELVSAMFVTLLACTLTITILDTGIWMMNKSSVATAAQNGARTAAIMGGVGTTEKATSIENAYGVSKSEACSLPSSLGFDTSGKTPIECSVLTDIAESKSLIQVDIKDVKCEPKVTHSIGEDVKCTVDWEYKSLPMGAFSFIKLTQNNSTSGVAQSEVALDDNYLQTRQGSGA